MKDALELNLSISKGKKETEDYDRGGADKKLSVTRKQADESPATIVVLVYLQ